MYKPALGSADLAKSYFVSLFRTQAFDINSVSCDVPSNASSTYAETWKLSLWLEFLCFASDFVHLNVFSQKLQGMETPSK